MGDQMTFDGESPEQRRPFLSEASEKRSVALIVQRRFIGDLPGLLTKNSRGSGDRELLRKSRANVLIDTEKVRGIVFALDQR